jgi:hypothetical protein
MHQGRHTAPAFLALDPPDGGDPDLGRLGEVMLFPAQERPGSSSPDSAARTIFAPLIPSHHHLPPRGIGEDGRGPGRIGNSVREGANP